MGMMSTRPLDREMMWAGTACSVEVKRMDRMILTRGRYSGKIQP